MRESGICPIIIDFEFGEGIEKLYGFSFVVPVSMDIILIFKQYFVIIKENVALRGILLPNEKH